MQRSFSREASPSTPPDSQLLYQFSLFHNKSTQNQFAGPSVSSTPIHTTTIQNTPFQPFFVNPPLVNPPLFPAMATWYALLVLPQPLLPLPNDYQSKIPHFTRKESTTSQQHVDRMGDAFDYMEIEEETVKMRIFAQILGGDVNKWFKKLPPNSINDLPALHQTFINKWELKNNPLQILAEYSSLKRNQGESILD